MVTSVEIIKWSNLALRFVLELCALAALGYWGFHTNSRTLVKFGLGIGAPLVAALVWSVFGAPKSDHHLTGWWYLLLEIGVFGSAAAALVAA